MAGRQHVDADRWRGAIVQTQKHNQLYAPTQPQPEDHKIVIKQSNSDMEQLKAHYKFLPDEERADDFNNDDAQKPASSTTWQERMASNYSSQLFKEYGIIDFTTIVPHLLLPPGDQSSSRLPNPQIGLRWRTQKEVETGLGFTSCGNRRCPAAHPKEPHPNIPKSHNLPYGNQHLMRSKQSSRWDVKKTTDGLISYELPFKYQEGVEKLCLVKIKTCLGCSVLLGCAKELTSKGGKRKKGRNDGEDKEEGSLLQRSIDKIVELRKSWLAEKQSTDQIANDDQREVMKGSIAERPTKKVKGGGTKEEEEGGDVEHQHTGLYIDRVGDNNLQSEDEQKLFESLNPPPSP
jgi:hypothetical protein